MEQQTQSKQPNKDYKPTKQSESGKGSGLAVAKRRQASPEVTPEYLASLPAGTKIVRVTLTSDLGSRSRV